MRATRRPTLADPDEPDGATTRVPALEHFAINAAHGAQ
jgi:hypothetical protein